MSSTDEASHEYAEELVEKIEAGELPPGDVPLDPIIEDDLTAMPPELWERLPEDKRQEYNERVKQRDEQDLQRERQELGREQREQLDALESGVVEDDEMDIPTATVTFGDAELEVSRRMSGRVEQAIEDIREESQKPPEEQSLDDVVNDLLDGIMELIVDDDEPEDDPHRFTDRDVWEAFYLDHGSEGLLKAFETIAEPARQRREELESSFRDERRGGRGTESR